MPLHAGNADEQNTENRSEGGFSIGRVNEKEADGGYEAVARKEDGGEVVEGLVVVAGEEAEEGVGEGEDDDPHRDEDLKGEQGVGSGGKGT